MGGRSMALYSSYYHCANSRDPIHRLLNRRGCFNVWCDLRSSESSLKHDLKLSRVSELSVRHVSTCLAKSSTSDRRAIRRRGADKVERDLRGALAKSMRLGA